MARTPSVPATTPTRENGRANSTNRRRAHAEELGMEALAFLDAVERDAIAVALKARRGKEVLRAMNLGAA
jgi:hypothetical protein